MPKNGEEKISRFENVDRITENRYGRLPKCGTTGLQAIAAAVRSARLIRLSITPVKNVTSTPAEGTARDA